MRSRSIHCVLLGLGALLSLVVAGDRSSAQQTPGVANFREAFLRLDANGDTMLEENEVPEEGREAFQRLLKRGDANKDGKLDGEELRALTAKLRALGNPAGIAQRLRSMDKDGDGRISRAEFSGPAQTFTRLDADKDEFLSREEFARLPDRPTADPAPPKPETGQPEKPEPQTPASEASPATDQPRPAQAIRRLLSMDADGDGRVSRDEFKGRPTAFGRLDANKDGFLDRDDRPADKAGGAGAPDGADARLRRLKAMDSDGDGKLSRSEFGGPEELFDRLDTDKDGFLTKDDRSRAIEPGPRPESKGNG
jgi:Ca2+-binding EF-hand superfamily protein